MKKTITILFAVIVAVFAVSCSKDTVETTNRIPVSLKANIGMMTKTSHEEVDGIIKTQWAANDTVSVITMKKTADGYVYAAVDNLINTAGAGDAAVFEGSITSIEGDVRRIVFYPCLKLMEDLTGKENFVRNVRSPYRSGSCEIMNLDLDNNQFIIYSNHPEPTSYPADNDNLDNIDIMSGVLVKELDGTYSSTLKKQMTMYKIDITIPEVLRGKTPIHEEAQQCYIYLELPGNRLSDGMFYYEDVTFNEEGNVEFTVVTPYPEHEGRVFEENHSVLFYLKASSIPSHLVMYAPVLGGASVASGEKIKIDSEWYGTYHAKKEMVMKVNQNFVPGNMYTFKATLESYE